MKAITIKMRDGTTHIIAKCLCGYEEGSFFVVEIDAMKRNLYPIADIASVAEEPAPL